jgi:hypothetical protein
MSTVKGASKPEYNQVGDFSFWRNMDIEVCNRWRVVTAVDLWKGTDNLTGPDC